MPAPRPGLLHHQLPPRPHRIRHHPHRVPRLPQHILLPRLQAVGQEPLGDLLPRPGLRRQSVGDQINRTKEQAMTVVKVPTRGGV